MVVHLLQCHFTPSDKVTDIQLFYSCSATEIIVCKIFCLIYFYVNQLKTDFNTLKKIQGF